MAWTGSTPDVTAPNAARIYDLYLSGRSGFCADRDLADRVRDVFGPPAPGHLPAPEEISLRNRMFLDRAVSWAARRRDAPVRQFIDLGAGYPVGGRVIALPDGGTVTLRDTHQAAADGGSGARVAYIDRDPLAVSRMSAIAADGTGTVAAEGDLSDPEAILADPVVRGCIDFRRPVCLVLGAVLQLWAAGAARGITSAWLSAVVPGSVLAVSVPRIDDEGLRERAGEAFTAARFWNHTAAEVEGMLAGTEILPPGVVPARGWQGGWRDFAEPDAKAYVLAALGVKP